MSPTGVFWIVVGGLFALAVLVSLVRVVGSRRRTLGMTRFATVHGLSFSRRDPFGLLRLGFNHFLAAGGFPARAAGSLWGTMLTLTRLGFALTGAMFGQKLENVMSGEWKEVRLKVADHSYRVTRHLWTLWRIRRWRRFSVALADLDAFIPQLSLTPRRFRDRLDGDIRFESEAFNRMFEVSTQHREFAFQFLDAPMMAFLLDAGPGFSFEVVGGQALVSCSRLPVTGLERLLDVAAGFHRRVPHLVRAEYAALS
jgi:hypothetical protein